MTSQPAAGCELDPVAEIDGAAGRRLRGLGRCGLRLRGRWLPCGLRGWLLCRRYRLARGDGDIRRLIVASPGQHHDDAANSRQQDDCRSYDRDDHHWALLGWRTLAYQGRRPPALEADSPLAVAEADIHRGWLGRVAQAAAADSHRPAAEADSHR